MRILESIVERMDSLESKFGTAQTQTNSIQSQVTDLQGDLSTSVNALDLLNADMIEQFETHDTQIDSISTAIANAVAALPTGVYTAPTTCDGCSPSISSEGADVVVSAPGGAVKVAKPHLCSVFLLLRFFFRLDKVGPQILTDIQFLSTY